MARDEALAQALEQMNTATPATADSPADIVADDAATYENLWNIG